MIAFIDDHRAEYGVEPICKVLPIAPSTYDEHAAKRTNPEKQSDRGKRDEVLQADIQRVFAANFEVYGARKVWRQLQREGRQVARCTVSTRRGPPVSDPSDAHPFQGLVCACVRRRAVATWVRAVLPST